MKKQFNPILCRALAAGVLCAAIGCVADVPVRSYRLEYDESLPQVAFAASRLVDALERRGAHVGGTNAVAIRFALEDGATKPGGFAIAKEGDAGIAIVSADANGLMYGGLEAAEQLALHGVIREARIDPCIQRRGIKMNIPLDARTPSYDDSGDAAQRNIAEMWSWDFWEAYLDRMAVNRYNVLSLWNPHPFPSMIKMEDYPDVALDDVCITTLEPGGRENEWGEPQMVSRNVVANLKVVRRMAIGEKIAFWKRVMQRAADRGIDLYFITWNVCPNAAAQPVEPFYRTYGAELKGERPGAYGISNEMGNPKTVAYVRAAVRDFLLTYPNVKGIGTTAGEHMVDQSGPYTREQWIWETYGLGILDAKRAQPDRKVDFIHRVWNTDMDKVMKFWDRYPDTFSASFKYARARLYSTPKPPFAAGHIEAMKKYGIKSWWNLRNDDIFVHRWGDPDYVRAFIANFDPECTAGFYMGSDGYVWGREFLEKRPALSGMLEFDKHWYRFMMWGRLAYRNDLDQAFFVAKLREHFPSADAERLYAAWQAASRIIPLVNRYHWRDWDYQWSVEGCLDMRNGFHTVVDFIDNPTLAGSGLLSPAAYAEAVAAGKAVPEGVSPFSVAQELRALAEASLSGAAALHGQAADPEFEAVLGDIASMAWLGRYYACKIEAAAELALYRSNRDGRHKQRAVSQLEAAVPAWREYAGICGAHYHVQMLARTRRLDWEALAEEVKNDVHAPCNQ